MKSHSPCPNNVVQVMTDEQLNQIVEAIAAGRYFWACVLILRFAGRNPLDFVPYRNYSRLFKLDKNLSSRFVSRKKRREPSVHYPINGLTDPSTCLIKIYDLDDLE